ncbi:MAG: HlyD family efflux transporter periplasmic adaptor subunit [Parvularculaceae bacterium]|nr:HlyD family efflux transporter periplasmic adaptor subunit [Parvularculaceae bacterium]
MSAAETVTTKRKPERSVDDRRAPEIGVGLMILLGFFGVFLGWASLAPLDSAVVAPGVVVVSGNRQVVQHRDGGVVGRLFVKEGQAVRAGDTLIELSAPEIVARYRALTAQVLDLQMRRARLAAEIAGARRLSRPTEWASLSQEDRGVADATFERHKREAAQLGVSGAWSEYAARIEGFRDRIEALERQHALRAQELRSMRALASHDYASSSEVQDREIRVSELEGSIAELRALIASAQQARSEAIRTIDAQLAELEPQRAASRTQVEMTRIRAPADGSVVGLSVHTEGGVVRAGEPLLEIVPQDRELVIDAHVRPEDADNVLIGQKAEIRVTAFHGRNRPLIMGEVMRLSADRLTDPRSGAGYFLAQVRVPAEERENVLRKHRLELRAGLPAEVVISLRKRTALQFLLEPLDQTLWRSFREE